MKRRKKQKDNVILDFFLRIVGFFVTMGSLIFISLHFPTGILPILLRIFGYWCFISLIILLAWSVRSDRVFLQLDWTDSIKWKRITATFIGVSAAIGFFIVFSIGTEPFLTSISSREHYVAQEEGWYSYKGFVSFLISVLAAYACYTAITYRNEKRSEGIYRNKSRDSEFEEERLFPKEQNKKTKGRSHKKDGTG